MVLSSRKTGKIHFTHFQNAPTESAYVKIVVKWTLLSFFFRNYILTSLTQVKTLIVKILSCQKFNIHIPYGFEATVKITARATLVTMQV